MPELFTPFHAKLQELGALWDGVREPEESASLVVGLLRKERGELVHRR